MGMTNYELSIQACKFAVGEMRKRGSVAFFTVTGDEMEQVTWADVIEWLNNEQERAEWLKSM